MTLLPDAAEFYAAVVRACRAHDRRYYVGGTDLDRRIADRVLDVGVLALARTILRPKEGWSERDVLVCATTTYQSVRAGGRRHWYYPEGYVPMPSGFTETEQKEQAP